MFNWESKSISTHTMQRHIQKLRLNSWSDWKKVMWSDESRFTLFQSDGPIRVRREVDEVMYPSCLVPNLQAFGGSAVIWGWFSWSGLGSATMCAQNIFSSLMARAYSKMTMPGFIRLRLWTSGSGRLTQHVHTLMATTESRPEPQWESFGCAGEGFAQWSDSPIISTRSWWKTNATLVRNKSWDLAEPYRNNAIANACRNES